MFGKVKMHSLEVHSNTPYDHTFFRPRLVQGQRTCILPHAATAVTLFLPQWAETVHPKQQDDAEMDPWLNLVGEDQLLELVSGRVVAAH